MLLTAHFAKETLVDKGKRPTLKYAGFKKCRILTLSRFVRYPKAKTVHLLEWKIKKVIKE